MLELIYFQCLLVLFNSFSFFFYAYLMTFFIAFRRETGRWRERGIDWWTSCLCCNLGMDTQPRYVPWPRIKPITFQGASTYCKDVTKVMFSKVTDFRKLPSCYCCRTYSPCGWSDGGSGTGDFVTHLQNDIWNTCVQCSWEELSILCVIGLIHNCENIFSQLWKVIQNLSQ